MTRARAAILAAAALMLASPPARAQQEPANFGGDRLTPEQFVAAHVPAELDHAAITTALQDAGANWPELAHALEYALPDTPGESLDELEAMAWLITSAPHLDRLELSGFHLAMHFQEMHFSGLTAGFDVDSELFRRYVLNYRFDDEPVTHWLPAYNKAFAFTFKGQPGVTTDQITTVVQKAAAGFTVVERGYFGNLTDPVSLLRSRSGTARELALLVAAALRSQGFATRFVRENRSAESWVEVYTGDPRAYDAQAWSPVYPGAPERTGDVAYATELCGGRITVVTAGDAFGREQVTGRYMPLGYVTPAFTRSGAAGPVLDKDYSGWAITAWNAKTGGFVALDDLEYPGSDKDYPLDAGDAPAPEGTYALGPGEYRLECGVRYPGGTTHVQVRPFTLLHAEQLALSVSLDPPADLPRTAMVEREVALGQELPAPAAPRAGVPIPPQLQPSGRYVFLVGDDGEPSLRARELLEPLRSRSSVFYQDLRLAAEGEATQAFIRDVLKVTAEDPLPVVIVVVDGKTRLYQRGYNLNVAQWVQRALEGE